MVAPTRPDTLFSPRAIVVSFILVTHAVCHFLDFLTLLEYRGFSIKGQQTSSTKAASNYLVSGDHIALVG